MNGMLALHAGLLMTVVVLCIQESLTQCNYGDVRLVNGSASNEGVVEVCIDDNWGNICADRYSHWGPNDATVICRQLGYPYDYYGFAFWHSSGRGNAVLGYVDCSPFDEHDELLVRDCDVGRWNSCNNRYIAYVVCRDDSRVQDVRAELINTASASNAHTVSVTWTQNASAAEPTSFVVKCQNDFNTVRVMVNNKTNTTELVGLLPSSSYNCCVSGVYRDVYYVARERCTQNSEVTVQASNSTNVVGGVLGFLVLLLLVLLIISVVALVCVLRPSERLKNSALYGRLSRLDTTQSTTIPVSNNSSYVTQPPTSRAPRQAVRPANPTAARPEGGATAPNYSSIGPDYESIESRRQVQLEGGSNRVNMRERYEFAEVHAETDGQNTAQGSMDYEVPVPSASQSEDYSHLQH